MHKIHSPADGSQYCSNETENVTGYSSAHLNNESSSEIHPCLRCDRIFRNCIDLSSHMRILHTPAAITFQCQFCAQKFKSITHMNQHIEATHSETCGKLLSDIPHLGSHIRNYHEYGPVASFHNRNRQFLSLMAISL